MDDDPQGPSVPVDGPKARVVCRDLTSPERSIEFQMLPWKATSEGRLLMLSPLVLIRRVSTEGSSNRLFCFLSNRTPHDSKTSAWGRGRKGLDGMRKLGGSSRIIRWAGRIVKPGAYGGNP